MRECDLVMKGEEVLVPFAASLADIGGKAAKAHAARGVRSVRKGAEPNVDSHMRHIAGTDRAPARKPEIPG